MRQIVLDTETTGIRVEEGHRIIEIGCLELINRKLTNQHFHCYFNPEREVEVGALAVHGITNEFLRDKPPFKMMAKELIDFIKGAELIIHNAPFDLSFLDYELRLMNEDFKPITDYCRIIDTLKMARQLHVGQRNSLDALCKRYKIDNSKREWHGALLDAHLLTQVYLIMTGGQGSFFESLSDHTMTSASHIAQSSIIERSPDAQQFMVLEADIEEINEHQRYLQKMREKGKCLWLDDE